MAWTVVWTAALLLLPAAEWQARAQPDPFEPKHSTLSSRTVRTKYGDLRGVVWELDGRHLGPVEVFRGIPYASPPVGNLRFMPPVNGAQWKGTKMADRFSPVCPQRLPDISDEQEALRSMPKGRYEYLRRLLTYLQDQSEDCLYLNIYAPAHCEYIICNHQFLI
jgi:neuroligin